MGANLCKADIQELEAFPCPGVQELELYPCPGTHSPENQYFCGVRDDLEAGLEEPPSSYPFQDFFSDVPEEERVRSLDPELPSPLFAKSLGCEGWKAQIGHETPILPEAFSDEEDDEEANLAHVNSDMEQALHDNGDDKYECTVESAQSNGIQAAVTEVDVDSWEKASEQNPGAQPTFLCPDKATMCGELVREATEKFVVDIDAGIDDVKQTRNLACLASDVGQTRIPCNISDTTDSNSSVLSRRLCVPKVSHFLNSLSTCRGNSYAEEEQLASIQQISIDNDTESVDFATLDGVWMLDDGEHVAVVKGSDVKLLGDDADLSFQLQELDAGVWAITMDDEEFLADCSKRKDGTLVLHWSDGLTWVRKEGTAIESVSTHEEKLQEKCQSISSSASSSWSSSSSSSDSSVSAGEVAELVPAVVTSKVGKFANVADFEVRICQINEADLAGGTCKVDNVGQARHPSKADKMGGAGEASKTIDAYSVNQDGQICEAPLTNVVGDGAVAEQVAGEDVNVRKTRGTGEADDTSKVSKTFDVHNVNMGGKFNEAGQVGEAGKVGELIWGKTAQAVQP